MATFINDKTRLFKNLGDPTELPTKKRSEARIKEYRSATDARAWSNNEQEQKEYILDLMNAESPKQLQLGKYVPIEVLIDTLLANKNADIKKLGDQIDKLEKLLKCYDDLDLTPDQRAKLNKLKSQVYGSGDHARDGDENSVVSETPSAVSSKLTAASATSSKVGSVGSETSAKVGSEGSATSAKVGSEGSATSAKVGSEGSATSSKAEAEGSEKESGTSSKAESEGSAKASAGSQISGGSEVVEDDVATLHKKLEDTIRECDKHKELARRAIEQLESIKNIMQERDDLQQKLRESEEEILKLKESLEKRESCEDEIKEMENEVERLKSSGKVDEFEIMKRELDVVKKTCSKLQNIKEQNKILKAENDDLKNQLNPEFSPDKKEEAKSIDRLKEHHSAIACIDCEVENLRDPSVVDDHDEADMKQYYKEQVAILNEKVDKLKEVTKERDRLQESVTRLETELQGYEGLSDEVESFKKKSKMLDDVLEERESLHKRLSRMKGMEDELLELKRKAARVDELERLLAEMEGKCGVDISEAELEALRLRAQEADVLRIERDRMKVKLDELGSMDDELKELENKSKSIEALQNERDQLKDRCAELEAMLSDYNNLKRQLDEAQAMNDERDAYLRKVRDCECVIADQEEEINRLVSHVDRLSKGQEKEQELTKKAMGDLRDELDKKNELIAQSEQQLDTMQSQLRNTIDEVSNETTDLNNRIAELEKQLAELEKQLADKDSEMAQQLQSLQEENKKLQDIVDKMQEYNDNEKLKSMLKKSKLAVHKAADVLDTKQLSGVIGNTDDTSLINRMKDLEKQLSQAQNALKECERMTAENKALRKHSGEIQTVAKDQIQDLANELKLAREKIDQLTKENLDLKKHIDELTKDADSALTNKIKELEKQLDDSKINRKTIDPTIGGDSNKIVNENADLKKQIDAMKKSMTGDNVDLINENTKCRDKLKELERQLEDAKILSKKDQPELAADNEKLTKELNELKNKLKDGANESTLKENNDLKNEMEMLKKKLKEGGHDITSTKGTDGAQDSTFKENEKLNEENELLKKKLKEGGLQDATLKENEDLRKELENLKNSIKRRCSNVFAKENADLKKELENLKNSIKGGDTSNVFAKENADLKKELEDLKNSIKGGDTSNVFAKENADLKKELENLKNSIKGGDTSNVFAKENADLKKELENLKNSIKGGDTSNVFAKENTDLKNELDSLKQKLKDGGQDAFLKENNELKKQLEEANKQKGAGVPDATLKENDELKKELESLKNQLKGDAQGSSKEVDALKKELDDMKKKMSAAQGGGNVPEAVQQENDNLKKQLEELKKKSGGEPDTKDKEDVTNQLKQANKENDDLKKEIERLQKASPDLTTKPDAAKGGLSDDSSDLKKEIERLNKVIASSGSDQQMVNQLQTAYAEIDDLKKELEKMKQLVHSTGDNAAKQQLDDQAKEIDRLKKVLQQGGIPDDHDTREKQELLDMIQQLENQLGDMGRDEKKDKGKDDKDPENAQLRSKIKELEDRLLKTKDCESQLKKLETELEKQKQDSLETIKSLKAQYDRDVKNLHNKYNDGIQKLQASHEEILSRGNQDLERENDELKRQSRQSKLMLDALQSKLDDKDDKKMATLSKSVQKLEIEPCDCGDDRFRKLLKKILNDGIESLSFDDLQFMHTKVCDATSKIIDKNRSSIQRTEITESYRNMPSVADTDYKRRQKVAQSQVAKLQLEVALERQRLEDLRSTLDLEKQTNKGLEEQVKKKSKAVSCFMNALEEEQSKSKLLEMNLQQERDKSRQLSSILSNHDQTCSCMHKDRTTSRRRPSERDRSRERSSVLQSAPRRISKN
ncbi:PREDICTED: LOW QUALITY PROTEIN: early endosome antigen 1-like [Nicrophorus vespilloides]|uniref:LOW QUALITY PROTEIN: early endosome antigen 1-like n=1 Tax=Nicrophorus vespilloides TaxID=110193 RepID=A0ABM1MML2_NICVS|nr:PREDICTED: LOW QUALITY PROTEIN: early endosome antigen 1-like [Nicrophorus vespilloides]